MGCSTQTFSLYLKMFSKEAELKIKFEYEGQKRAILLPQPVKYHQLVDKLHKLCGSLFTIKYSAAEGQFIRDVECQEDLDDVIRLTKNAERINCLPLRLVPCASSLSLSLSQLSTAGVSTRPTKVKWSPSLIARTPQQLGGFFRDEPSDPIPSSGFEPCIDSPPPGINSSPLRCTTRRTSFSRPEKRVDYIPETYDDQLNTHPSMFIPDSKCFHASSNYNLQKKKASDKQTGQRSHESGTSGGASGFTPRHVRSKSDSQGIEGDVSAFLSSLKPTDGMKCRSMSRPSIAVPATAAEHDSMSPCSCTPTTGPCQGHMFSPPGSRAIQTGLTNKPPDKSCQSHIGRELDSGFSSNSIKNEKQKNQNGRQSSFTPGNWVKGKLLGRGAFGQVYTGYDKDRGIEFAVKQVPIYSQSNEVVEQIKALEMEISVLQDMHNDYIVEYYGMQREPECLSIFIEFIPMGSLRDHINRYGMLTEKVIGRYTSQILKGLAFLHSKMIVHRDIKSANILRDHNGNLKLGDFGAAKLLQSQSIAETSKIAGTPYFMAPEIIRAEACGCRSDIWSLGCTVVEMLTTNPPWHRYDSIAAIYRIGNVWPPEYELPNSASDNVKDFLHLCFAASARDRPRAEELLIHTFISRNLS